MKSFLTKVLMTAALLAISAVAASAQCDPEETGALYKKFLADHKGKPEQKKAAGETAKTYISRFGECPGDAERKITGYIKDWLAKYEAALIESACTSAVEKNPTQAFELCKPYVASNPENLRAHLLLSLAGIRKASDRSLNDATVRAARRSLELINAGQTVTPWFMGGTREETVATLEFYIASLTLETAPAEAAATMLRLAHSESSYKKDPNTYYLLAKSLHSSEVKKDIGEYTAKCAQETTAACDEAFKKIESKIDRVIDAYARAVALGSGKPEHDRITAVAKPALVELWKQRHEDAGKGVDKFVAEVLSKKLP
jgi:hypothetical protein